MLERAAALAARTHELTDFLVNVLKLDAVPGTLAATITYHDSCAGLREMGVKDQPRTLLSRVPGLKLAEMAECETCCGFGGTFSVKNPDVSAAMCADKVAAVSQTRAEVLCAGDDSCLMHIGGTLSRMRTGVRVMHLAQILAAASDRTAASTGAAG